MEKYLDWKMIVSLIVALVIILILMAVWNKVSGNATAGSASITEAQYNALSADDKAKYVKNADGTYSKKS